GCTTCLWIITILALCYAGILRRLGISWVIAAIWNFSLASALAGCTSAVIIQGIPPFVAASGAVGAVARIVMISLLFGALYLGAVILLHRGCAPLYLVARRLREMVPWGRLSTSSPAIATTPWHQHARGAPPSQGKEKELVRER